MLITSMLQHDPMHRPSIAELFQHPWMQGDVPSHAEILKEFQQRNLQVVEEREKEREARQQAKADAAGIDFAGMRANPDEVKIDAYVSDFQGATQFFTTVQPAQIEDALRKLCVQKEFAYDFKEGKQVMNFTYETHKGVEMATQIDTGDSIVPDDAETEAELEKAFATIGKRKLDIEVRITKKEEENFCVQFTCKEGDKFAFSQAYKDVTTGILDFAVDKDYIIEASV